MDTPTPALTKAQKADIRESLGGAIHTAFRKASEHPNTAQIWKLIDKLPDKDWRNILDFIVECL